MLTISDVAEMLSLSPRTVRDLFHAGRIPGYQLGGRRHSSIRFRQSEIERWLEGGRPVAGACASGERA